VGFLDILCPIEKPEFNIGDKICYKDDFRNNKYGIGKIIGYSDGEIVCSFEKSDCKKYFTHREFANEIQPFLENKYWKREHDSVEWLPNGYKKEHHEGQIVYNCGRLKRLVFNMEIHGKKYFRLYNKDGYWCVRSEDEISKQHKVVNVGNYVRLRPQYYKYFLEQYGYDLLVENCFFVRKVHEETYELSLHYSSFYFQEPIITYHWLFEPMSRYEYFAPRRISWKESEEFAQIDPREDIEHFYGVKFKPKEEKEMTKDDLKTGMVVKIRNDMEFLVVKDSIFGDLLVSRNMNFKLSEFSKGMKHESNNSYDIIKVLKPHDYNSFSTKPMKNCQFFWERKEPKEIPMSEVMDILAEKLGCSKDNIKITG
jgi:hypothetical protein